MQPLPGPGRAAVAPLFGLESPDSSARSGMRRPEPAAFVSGPATIGHPDRRCHRPRRGVIPQMPRFAAEPVRAGDRFRAGSAAFPTIAPAGAAIRPWPPETLATGRTCSKSPAMRRRVGPWRSGDFSAPPVPLPPDSRIWQPRPRSARGGRPTQPFPGNRRTSHRRREPPARSDRAAKPIPHPATVGPGFQQVAGQNRTAG